MKLIDKAAVVAELKRRMKEHHSGYLVCLKDILSFLDTLEVKEVGATIYVVSRSEEHADYVEEVFFDENKAQEYCDQFKGDENAYVRYITEVKPTL